MIRKNSASCEYKGRPRQARGMQASGILNMLAVQKGGMAMFASQTQNRRKAVRDGDKGHGTLPTANSHLGTSHARSDTQTHTHQNNAAIFVYTTFPRANLPMLRTLQRRVRRSRTRWSFSPRPFLLEVCSVRFSVVLAVQE